VPDNFLEESLAVLTRTPHVLTALLADLPDAWTEATEGPDTWSAYTVVGHLIHGEKTDWLPRVNHVLTYGANEPFPRFDREAQLHQAPRPLSALLEEFAALRQQSLADLRQLHLQPEQLALKGLHPNLGPVTLRQLLATWTAHDLAHLLQISRIMAKRYRHEVGPWAAYLSVMR